MKKNDTKKCFLKYFVLSFLCMVFGYATAQTSYVGDGSTIHFNGSILTNQVIVPSASATVNQTAGTTFTGTGYVDGTVNVKEDGATTVPVGDGAVKSTVDMTTAATDDIATAYVASAATGTMDPSLATFALSDAEYWTVTKTAGTSTDVAVSGLANTASTYGGEAAIGTPVLVRRDNASSNWVLYSANPGFGEFAYASETATLATPQFNVNNFSFYPNPVSANASSINFNLPSSIQQLDVTMYDVTGKVVQRYNNVPVQTGANSINKPNLSNGLYLIQFSFNNGAQQTTKRLIVK
jgi:hypothetical protein